MWIAIRNVLGLGVVALVLHAPGPAAAAADPAAQAKLSEQNLDADTKARLGKADQGSRTIDVSAYPAGAQQRYSVFATTCTKCHTLARPINSHYALPSEWLRYVKRMMRKPGSGINKAKGRQIYEFLSYDSSVRKADLIEERLATLSPEERAKDEAKIVEIRGRVGDGS